ncbi:sulfatase-like hydrolase/transferase [Nocardioides sp. cx-169]|uniref:sulfatase-like hydrolase/transferase n=1 Tax=Nocardioides sp. cx-169 TaxID=2899080 RepID=UPI001E4EF088|nr:sulfatase-like hydrolase/transferase [Nocardioides sp. cx-169]MCD4536094.1 sulfatase-like hydrolase/transferase [Nocardioides sp. cx-169]
MAGSRRLAAVAAVLAVTISGVLAVGAMADRDTRGTRSPAADGERPTVVPAQAVGTDGRADIVLILMDDFSLELLATMPHAQRMATEGATYDNAFVVDSLCCPSRAAMATGQLPHQTGVLTNTPNDPEDPIGGYEAFVAHGNEQRQFSVNLQDAGYHTGFVGKFLNGYRGESVAGVELPAPTVPGWSDWQALSGAAYNGWDFQSTYLDADGEVQLQDHPKPPLSAPAARRDRAYATTVTARKAVEFLKERRPGDPPYFLEVATYAPHSSMGAAYPGGTQFPAAFRDRPRGGGTTGGNCGTRPCGELTLDDLTGYGDPREDNAPTYLLPDGSTAPAPPWRTNEITLTDQQALTRYRDRARMVQSVDRLVKRVRKAAGPDAYVFLTSDNGFHLGQHQLNGGKGTPYDSDSRVPLVVVGPGVVPGTRHQFVSNIDLAPTFEELAGVRTPRFRSGRSFAATLTRPEAPGARYAFFEHTYAKSQPGEVDTDEGSGGTIDLIPSFVAVRGERGLLVRLDLDPSWSGTDPAFELYRYDRPWEDVNVFAEDHDKPYARDLMRRLLRLDGCRPAQCRAAVR